MISRQHLAGAVVPLFLVSCSGASFLDSNYREDALLSVDRQSLEVEAASFVSEETVCDTVTVSSSRSWSLGKEESSEWLRTSADCGINPGGILKEWSIEVQFEDNPLPSVRTTQLSFTIDGKEVRVPVRQKAFTPVLEVNSPLLWNLPDTGGVIKLDIRSNCLWSVSVTDDSDALLTLPSNNGAKSCSYSLSVGQNKDISSTKEATVVFSAADASDVQVKIIQDKCVPFLEIDESRIQTSLLPVAGSAEIVFSTNENWSASLEDVEGEVSLSASEGQPGDELFLTYPSANTFSTNRATVVLRTGSGIEKRISFSQRPCLQIVFRKWPDNNGYSMVAHPLVSAQSGTVDIPRNDGESVPAYWTQKDAFGNTFTLFAGESDAMLHNNACGLVIGSSSSNPSFWIEFPSFEDKVLKEVWLMLGNSDVKLKNNEPTATGTSGSIVDLEGKTVEGGQTQTVKTYQMSDDWKKTLTIPSFSSEYYSNSESMFRFVLTDSKPGNKYRYSGVGRQVIRWFILFYE